MEMAEVRKDVDQEEIRKGVDASMRMCKVGTNQYRYRTLRMRMTMRMRTRTKTTMRTKRTTPEGLRRLARVPESLAGLAFYP
uniref:Uncharacterized protein n=1 Tax=Vespula pensylvanica TaxID=30213 RepID=A0A834PCU3_VESPE|nr:hypothetical protein H0235_003863 [Vespula pensylvanica]